MNSKDIVCSTRYDTSRIFDYMRVLRYLAELAAAPWRQLQFRWMLMPHRRIWFGQSWVGLKIWIQCDVADPDFDPLFRGAFAST
ncbi:uncharacterized protein LOC116841751 isoform X2 [Odontomachus brunneus]|uniref:uncharacterized protein LOC116841751 isoform X2 n=1 Tax=Odontomachus brunneus TaxID=486640 RepID=UPI0013F273A7|nr:uncharacterized protein LOC116841751 isoform X2 [Odontomachus brunneus]